MLHQWFLINQTLISPQFTKLQYQILNAESGSISSVSKDEVFWEGMSRSAAKTLIQMTALPSEDVLTILYSLVEPVAEAAQHSQGCLDKACIRFGNLILHSYDLHLQLSLQSLSCCNG